MAKSSEVESVTMTCTLSSDSILMCWDERAGDGSLHRFLHFCGMYWYVKPWIDVFSRFDGMEVDEEENTGKWVILLQDTNHIQYDHYEPYWFVFTKRIE